MIFFGLYALVGIVCVLSNNGKKKRSRTIACFLIFLGMQLLLGLRHIQYGGVDTQVYARDFMRIVNQNYSMLDIFRNFNKDYGFYLIAQFYSMFIHDMNAWVFACALPYTIAVTWMIYKYSKNMFLSFIMFLSFGYYLYNFQLMRHVFALGIIVLAYKYLEEEQYKKYVIATLIATFCHTIAILFFGAYFIRKGRITEKQLVWIVLGGFAILVFSQESIRIAVFNLIPFLRTGRFATFSTVGGHLSSEFFIQMIFVGISWVALFGKKKESSQTYIQTTNRKIGLSAVIRPSNSKFYTTEPNMTLLFNMGVVATLFYLMTIAIGESYRMAQYFSLFTIILVPNAINKIRDKRIRLLFIVLIVAFGVRHFFGGLFVDGSAYNPYVFFWESPQSLW